MWRRSLHSQQRRDPVYAESLSRIELDYPSALLVDYMTLLKDSGRWVIIAKSFNSALK